MSVELREIQRELQLALLSSPEGDTRFVMGDERLSASERLHVYRSAYHARLLEAMATDFSALHAYLGNEAFAQLVRDYVKAHPSRNYSLRWLGQHLPTFLRERELYREQNDLGDLATFEWALCHAFDAADATLVEASQLATLAPDVWPHLILEFHASVQVIALRGNTIEQWRELNAQKSPPSFQLFTQDENWLVWRQELKVLYRCLEPVEATAMALFLRGTSFETVCEALTILIDEESVPACVASWLGRWIGEGLISGFSVNQ